MAEAPAAPAVEPVAPVVEPVAPAAAVEPAAPLVDESFDAAFDLAAAEAQEDVTKPKVPDPEPVEPVEPAKPAEPVAPAAEPAAPAPVEPAAPVPAAAAPAPAKPAEPAPAPVETDEQKAAREAFEATLTPYEPTEEEVAALAQFEKDFPNEAKAIKAQLKRADTVTTARVNAAMKSVLQYVDQRVKPVETRTAEATFDRHMAAIRSAHPDYDTTIVAVPAWIEKQPALIKAAYKTAYEEGSVQDVIDLVAAYKASVTPAPAPAAPAPEAPKPKPAGADDLAPVGTRRATPTPTGQPDPNDFDGAFAAAAAAA